MTRQQYQHDFDIDFAIIIYNLVQKIYIYWNIFVKYE